MTVLEEWSAALSGGKLELPTSGPSWVDEAPAAKAPASQAWSSGSAGQIQHVDSRSSIPVLC